MEDRVGLLTDAHVHIFIIGAKDRVGARLLQPEVELGAPGGGLGCRAHGDGGLRSLQLHLHPVVGIGQHRLRLRLGSGLQRDLHIQLLPSRFGRGAVSAPNHQLILLRQKQAKVFQFIVFQRVHPHLRQFSVETPTLVICALRHLPVKGLHGLPLHLLLHGVRVQTNPLQHLGCGDLLAGGKIEAPAAVKPRGGAARAVAHHQTDAVAVPVGIPVHTDLRVLTARLSGLLVGLIFPEMFRIDVVQFIVDVGGIRAVAFQLRHMDGHMDGNVLPRVRLPHARNVLFQRVLVGDALLLGRLHRCGCGALGSCAGACGGRGGRCAAAAGQQQRRSQNHSSKTFVFHGGAPFYKAPDTGGVCPGQTGGCLVILCRFVPEHNSGHVGLALNHRAVDADELCLGAIRIVQQFIYKNPNGSILARILIFQSHHLLGRRFGDAGSSCQTVLAAILFQFLRKPTAFP